MEISSVIYERSGSIATRGRRGPATTAVLVNSISRQLRLTCTNDQTEFVVFCDELF